MFAVKTKTRATAIAGAAALIAAGIVGVTGSSASAAAGVYTALPASGPFAASTVVAVTGKALKSAAGVSKVGATANTHVQLAVSCGTSSTSSTGKIATGITSFSVVTATRLNATVAPGGTATDSKVAYKICVYAVATGTALLGSATWTAYPKPTVTGVNADTTDGGAGTDALGPNAGGNTIAIDGTEFTSKSTVKIGTVAATSVKFIDSTSLTAVVPAGTGTQKNVQVTTEGGSSAANTWYDYAWAITVSPTFGPLSSTTTDVTINGSGFAALTFGGVGARVFLLSGAYAVTDTTAADGVPDTNYIGECTAVQQVSDTEISCTMPSIATAQDVRVIVLPTSAVGALPAETLATQITSGSTYTFAPF